MHRVIAVDIDGTGTALRMHEEAYDALRRYLDDARARLADDPDRAEVIGDIERSIAGRLGERLEGQDRVLALGDVDAVLGEVGPVAGPATAPGSPPPASGWGSAAASRPGAGPGKRRRKLYRIKQGQWLAGVGVGLAAYSEIDLDWVHWILFFAILLTGGLFLIVYLIAAFLLPVVPTYEAWLAALDEEAASA